jgi:putative heme transporter
MWAWLMARVPPDRRATVDAAGRHAWTTTGGYMRGLTIVALFDAVGIGLARVMDRLIGLHPTVVLTAVTAGAVLWGIAGALLFVPLAAALTAAASVFRQRRTAARPDF